MKVIYSEKSSQIIEQFLVPSFIYAKSDKTWDFSSKEREILKDILPVFEEVHELFLPYKEELERYYLMGHGHSLLQIIYLDMIGRGQEVETVEQVHAYCLSLDESRIQGYLSSLLNTEREQMDETSDFWERLETSTIQAQNKWHFSQFYRKALSSMQELVSLSRHLIQLYQPYLDRGAAERKSYAAELSLEQVLEDSSYLSQFDWKIEEDEAVDLYILSPWLMTFISHAKDRAGRDSKYFILSCRIDRILASSKELDVDSFTSILKVMSDPTRYNVLVELTKPHAKSKDIAHSLHITGAAVSFHTQKLINAQLLLFNQEDKGVKYDTNKDLLKEVIAKLKADFDLADD